MVGVAEKPMSLEEFLAWEREQPERHEFVDGIIRMMVLNLSSIGVQISLDAIYEDTELDATRRQAEGELGPAA